MATLNISLPDSLHHFIQAQVEGGSYASASEYPRELVLEARRKQAKKELEAKLLASLKTPLREMTPKDWQALRDRARKGARRSQAG